MLDNLTASATASYSLTLDSVAFVPESANHLLVSLNGVIQKAGSSFTVSGSTLTFSSALTSSDSIDFVLALGNVLDIGTPSDATVTNAKTNFVSTSSAAGLQIKGDGTTDGTLQLNCSQNSHGIKLKSPAHSAGASYTLTFPTTDGNADEFLQTNGSGTLTWAAAGGISQAQQWRITSGFTFSSVQDIDQNWEISDSTGYGSLGSNLTQSSGIFTFPSTGYYMILATFNFRRATGDRGVGGNINVTTNNSSYSVVASSESNNSDVGGQDNTTYNGSCQTIIDCTDTSNVKFKLTCQTSGSDQTCDGDTNRNYTGFICVRLGDT